MITQTSISLISISDYFSRPLAIPNEFFYEGEAELANEMTDGVPDGPQFQQISPVMIPNAIDPDDFETLYKWFLS